MCYRKSSIHTVSIILTIEKIILQKVLAATLQVVQRVPINLIIICVK